MFRGQLPWKGLFKYLLGQWLHGSHIPQSSLGWQHGMLSPAGVTAAQCYSHHQPDLHIIKLGTSVPSRYNWHAMSFIMLQKVTYQPGMFWLFWLSNRQCYLISSWFTITHFDLPVQLCEQINKLYMTNLCHPILSLFQPQGKQVSAFLFAPSTHFVLVTVSPHCFYVYRVARFNFLSLNLSEPFKNNAFTLDTNQTMVHCDLDRDHNFWSGSLNCCGWVHPVT